jgi:hypothetical protein
MKFKNVIQLTTTALLLASSSCHHAESPATPMRVAPSPGVPQAKLECNPFFGNHWQRVKQLQSEEKLYAAWQASKQAEAMCVSPPVGFRREQMELLFRLGLQTKRDKLWQRIKEQDDIRKEKSSFEPWLKGMTKVSAAKAKESLLKLLAQNSGETNGRYQEQLSLAIAAVEQSSQDSLSFFSDTVSRAGEIGMAVPTKNEETNVDVKSVFQISGMEWVAMPIRSNLVAVKNINNFRDQWFLDISWSNIGYIEGNVKKQTFTFHEYEKSTTIKLKTGEISVIHYSKKEIANLVDDSASISYLIRRKLKLVSRSALHKTKSGTLSFNEFNVFNTQTGKVLYHIDSEEDEPIYAASWTNDEKFLFLNLGEQCEIHSLQTFKRVARMPCSVDAKFVSTDDSQTVFIQLNTLDITERNVVRYSLRKLKKEATFNLGKDYCEMAYSYELPNLPFFAMFAKSNYPCLFNYKTMTKTFLSKPEKFGILSGDNGFPVKWLPKTGVVIYSYNNSSSHCLHQIHTLKRQCLLDDVEFAEETPDSLINVYQLSKITTFDRNLNKIGVKERSSKRIFTDSDQKFEIILKENGYAVDSNGASDSELTSQLINQKENGLKHYYYVFSRWGLSVGQWEKDRIQQRLYSHLKPRGHSKKFKKFQDSSLWYDDSSNPSPVYFQKNLEHPEANVNKNYKLRSFKQEPVLFFGKLQDSTTYVYHPKRGIVYSGNANHLTSTFHCRLGSMALPLDVCLDTFTNTDLIKETEAEARNYQ